MGSQWTFLGRRTCPRPLEALSPKTSGANTTALKLCKNLEERGIHVILESLSRGKDSQGELVGYFELVIKMYPQGRMSYHFREMREGDYLIVKGPKAKRSCVKLDIYRKFSNALAGIVIASVAWIGYEWLAVISMDGLVCQMGGRFCRYQSTCDVLGLISVYIIRLQCAFFLGALLGFYQRRIFVQHR
ncbi:NADH--cytochrome b5 reductase 1 [Camellia lanceoleosa]|uniref:NADH--cytochrome b5 reductase 1 n=1 Tax=Camellia lanceoleosa TaxID=1840588 RepID=A0ACC0H9Z7_9ERIC|nr:NADH--cytochrome b5 reductase 1 [Camellia lanceoleosa]